MIETLPGLLLAVMIVITLILLPRLNDERPQSEEPRRPTEELHIKPRRDAVRSEQREKRP